MGAIVPNDGLLLQQLILGGPDFLKSQAKNEEIILAFNHMEDIEYEDSLKAWEQIEQQDDEIPEVMFYKSTCHLKLGNIDTALDLLLKFKCYMDEKNQKQLEAYLHNNLAWIYLLLDEMDKAEEHARIAMRKNKKIPYAQGTSGAILIELGRWKKGENLLNELVDFNFPNSITLMAAAHLGLGYF